jgi:AcrR family transcriptional regulator
METTYNTILEVSRKLFIERGYTAVSIREIAAKTGIAKATIYHHFPDKERILLALLEGTKAIQQEMLATIRAQTEPRRRIETAVRENLRLMSAITSIVHIVRRELPDGRKQTMKIYGPAMEEFRALLVESLERGRETGVFRPIQAEKAITALMAMIQGSFASAMLGDGTLASPEARAEAILDVFFNGVLA